MAFTFYNGLGPLPAASHPRVLELELSRRRCDDKLVKVVLHGVESVAKEAVGKSATKYNCMLYAERPCAFASQRSYRRVLVAVVFRSSIHGSPPYMYASGLCNFETYRFRFRPKKTKKGTKTQTSVKPWYA